MKGKLITLEGIEGVGKTTAQMFIRDWLKSRAGIEVLTTREPGGTPLAEAIRQLVVSCSSEKVYPETELLLMFAARAQHFNEVIKPALERGIWVVCDRFVDASYAYQGAGRGLSMKKIEQLETLVLNHFKADRVLILDAPTEVGMARARARQQTDRFEEEKIAFFEKIRAYYLSLPQKDPLRYAVIDANQPLPAVHMQLMEALHVLCSAMA